MACPLIMGKSRKLSCAELCVFACCRNILRHVDRKNQFVFEIPWDFLQARERFVLNVWHVYLHNSRLFVQRDSIQKPKQLSRKNVLSQSSIQWSSFLTSPVSFVLQLTRSKHSFYALASYPSSFERKCSEMKIGRAVFSAM